MFYAKTFVSLLNPRGHVTLVSPLSLPGHTVGGLVEAPEKKLSLTLLLPNCAHFLLFLEPQSYPLSISLSLLSCSSLSLCVLLPLPPFLPVFVVYNHLSFGWRTNLWNKNVLCSASFVELMEAHGHSRSSIKFLAHNSTTSIHSSHSPYPLFLGIFVRVCVCECVVMEK